MSTRHHAEHTSSSRYAGFLACVFALVLAFSLWPAAAFGDVLNDDLICGSTVEQRSLNSSSCPSVNATRVFVATDDGEVYFERNADEQANIASVTKVMTALVALQYGDLSETKITISDNAASIGESTAGLQSGDVLALENALKAMMINSGNDAALAIAECMGDSVTDALKEEGVEDMPNGGVEGFVYAMNKKASELGMKDSLFANPHGLDFDKYNEDMYSTAHDVYLMCKEAMKNDTFKSIVATDATTIPVTRGAASAEVALESTDTLLGTYDGACGVKTGYTEKAGECFAGAFTKDDQLIYCIVLNSDSEAQRFTDATTLAEWFETNNMTYPLIHSEESTTYTKDDQEVSVPVVAHVASTGWIDKTFKATLADPEAAVNVFALEGNISQEFHLDDVSGSVKAGDKVGTVDFYQHNEVVSTQDVVAAEDCAAPNFFEGIGIWWQRLFMDDSQQSVAESVIVNTTPLIYGANATIGS